MSKQCITPVIEVLEDGALIAEFGLLPINGTVVSQYIGNDKYIHKCSKGIYKQCDSSIQIGNVFYKKDYETIILDNYIYYYIRFDTPSYVKSNIPIGKCISGDIYEVSAGVYELKSNKNLNILYVPKATYRTDKLIEDVHEFDESTVYCSELKIIDKCIKIGKYYMWIGNGCKQIDEMFYKSNSIQYDCIFPKVIYDKIESGVLYRIKVPKDSLCVICHDIKKIDTSCYPMKIDARLNVKLLYGNNYLYFDGHTLYVNGYLYKCSFPMAVMSSLRDPISYDKMKVVQYDRKTL